MSEKECNELFAQWLVREHVIGVSNGTRGAPIQVMGLAAGSQQSSAASVREPALTWFCVPNDSKAPLDPKCPQSIATRIKRIHLEIALFHTRNSIGETVQRLVSSATLRANEFGF